MLTALMQKIAQIQAKENRNNRWDFQPFCYSNESWQGIRRVMIVLYISGIIEIESPWLQEKGDAQIQTVHLPFIDYFICSSVIGHMNK